MNPLQLWRERAWAPILMGHAWFEEVNMPLSEYEQRVLAQMESQLRDADPKLARSLDSPATIDLRRLSIGVGIGIVGLCVLVAGVATSQIWLGVLGFIAMLIGALAASYGATLGGLARDKLHA